MSGITLKAVVGCNMGCVGCYEKEIFRSNDNKPAPYDLTQIILSMMQVPVDPQFPDSNSLTFHGGEALLMPVDDMRMICQAAREMGRTLNVQTNGSLITDRHVELFTEFKFSVGVSINGPGELNRDRRAGRTDGDTDRMTERIESNILKMREAKLSVSLICVISKTNAGDDDKLARLIEWAARYGEEHGIWWFRFNPLHDDYDAAGIELSAEEAAHAYNVLCEATFQDKRRLWNPFREWVDNLWGLGRQPCVTGECDVYRTDAVYAIFGDGSTGNCLRTGKDGISYLRTNEKHGTRGDILQQIPFNGDWIDGGCGGCRFWRVCMGGCPAEGVAGDWRNKSRFCRMYYKTFQHIEQKIQNIVPNWTPVPDWTTNDEADLLQSIDNRNPRISPLNPCNPNWSKRPSTFDPNARYHK